MQIINKKHVNSPSLPKKFIFGKVAWIKHYGIGDTEDYAKNQFSLFRERILTKATKMHSVDLMTYTIQPYTSFTHVFP